MSAVLSPDGKQVATGTRTGSGISSTVTITESVHILNLADGRLLGAPLDGQPFGMVFGLGDTADGRYLIAGHEERRTRAIHIIDAKTLEVVDTVHVGAANFWRSERQEWCRHGPNRLRLNWS